MNIIFLAQCYAPEEVSAAVLITELATDLAGRGHQVTVATIAPNYPYGRVYAGYRNRLFQSETIDGVRVVRTWSYISPHRTFWRRLLLQATYCATAVYGGLSAGRPDILVSYSPPLPLGLTAWLLSRLWNVPWVLQLEDLLPEAAVAAGYLRNQRAIAFFSKMADFQYRRAAHITLIAETFRQNLLARKVPDSKITLIPVWADPDMVRPRPKNNSFRAREGLQDKFVVLYAGNLGATSCLEDIVPAAIRLQPDTEICFVLVGEGLKKPELITQSQRHGLQNVRFLPYQPRETFAEVLAAADLNLVTLSAGAAHSSLPSKVFNGMASARPILAVAPLDSELSRLVSNARCGLCVAPGQPDGLAERILYLKKYPETGSEMGIRGRSHLKRHYARQQCVDRYEEMLSQQAHRKTALFSS